MKLSFIAATAMIAFGAATASAQAMDHSMSDHMAAEQFKEEAKILNDKAATHKASAAKYRAMRNPKSGDYATVAKHCDDLASAYEAAAKKATETSMTLMKMK